MPFRGRACSCLPVALGLLVSCGDDGATVGGSSSGTESPTADSTTASADASTGTATTGVDSSGTSADPDGTSGSATGSSTDAPTSTGGSSGSSSDGTTTGGAMLDADALFTYDGLARIDLTLDDAAVASLDAAPTVYVHADAQILLAGGEVLALPDIGVRLKGVYGSFRTLDQKAAFLLRFDHFDPDQEPLGLEKLALNNMVQDPSMIHEQLAYALFRDAGVPAPRSSYARVYVNDELYGLYATVEATDNSVFLDTWFGNDDGNLYEGEYGSDFYPGWGPSFDLDNGVDVGFADIEALAAAFDAMVDPATFVEDADAVIDLARYLQFAATEIFIGHWDGYAWTRNNYFVYRGGDGRWTFIPWGTDQTFFDYLPIWGGDGRVERMCGSSLPCRQQLAAEFAAVSQRVVDLALVERCDDLLALIDEAMLEDPRREYDPATVYWAIGVAQDFLLNRPQDVENQFVCTDPSAVDDDGDLASGCGFDCNDADPDVYPGAPEQCNAADDDCNGVLDDDPMCPQCITGAALGGGTLAFCFSPRTYADAEADCVDQGGHLASIHSQEIQDNLVARAFEVQVSSWWIGLDDQASEGDYTWTDGTPFDFSAWAGGEPNDAGGSEDCGHVTDWGGGAWNDIGCDAWMPYVCRLP